MSTLKIENLHVTVEGKEILKGVNLVVNDNETVAMLGPNGHGKSTLLAAIMGNPKYTVTEGTIEYDGKDWHKVLQEFYDMVKEFGDLDKVPQKMGKDCMMIIVPKK